MDSNHSALDEFAKLMSDLKKIATGSWQRNFIAKIFSGLKEYQGKFNEIAKTIRSPIHFNVTSDIPGISVAQSRLSKMLRPNRIKL